MIVKVDKTAFRTLTLFLLSCRSILGDGAVATLCQYRGPFPASLRDLLGDYGWIMDKLAENVLSRMEKFAIEGETEILSADDICLFFGNREHLDVAKKSCLVYEDLSQEQRIVGHVTLPMRVTEIRGETISGSITYNNLPIENVFNIFPNVTEGDIVLIHFATVVLSDPSSKLLEELQMLQRDFISRDLEYVRSIAYESTYKNAKDKIKKYIPNHL